MAMKDEDRPELLVRCDWCGILTMDPETHRGANFCPKCWVKYKANPKEFEDFEKKSRR